MTEKEQQRIVKPPLAVIRHVDEVTGNVAATRRYFGISRGKFRSCRLGDEAGKSSRRVDESRPIRRPVPSLEHAVATSAIAEATRAIETFGIERALAELEFIGHLLGLASGPGEVQ